MVDKLNPAAAANAYKGTSAIGQSSGVGGGDGVSFGDMVKSSARDVVGSLKQSEQVSAAAVTGKADLNDVVKAVTQAELTLQTVVAMRDRMVSAYQEISRMAI